MKTAIAALAPCALLLALLAPLAGAETGDGAAKPCPGDLPPFTIFPGGPVDVWCGNSCPDAGTLDEALRGDEEPLFAWCQNVPGFPGLWCWIVILPPG